MSNPSMMYTNGHVNGHVNGVVHGAKSMIRVGIIGCGEISQVAHIPMLNMMSDYYRITYLCDISKQSLEHCAGKVAGSRPKTTTDANELCASSDVDAVIVCNATAFHPTHAILALQHDKHVFVEKPLALCYRDLDAIQAAEAVSKGRVFVGYMRRYAPAFLQAMAEVGDRSKIQYARVRDIIGPNEHFVRQSGTFPKRFNDFEEEDSTALKAQDDDILLQALIQEFEVPLNDHSKRALQLLGGLGSHDLSAMREALGMPQAVIGADMRWPIWSAMLKYENFTVVYESGINSVPIFDAHIEIYTNSKIVRVNYDTPYIKGLPTTITIREKIEGSDSYQERVIRPTYEDSYTVEFKEWYDCVTQGKDAKTTIADAREDLDIFKMLLQASYSK
jgi:predicted dehydrogenase